MRGESKSMARKALARGAAIAGLIAAASIGGSALAQTVVIQNGTVHTIGSAGIIENGDIIVRDGLIAAVGQDLTAPAGATIIDAEGQPVTPGFISPYSSIGLKEISLDNEANDTGPDPESGFALSAALDAIDAFNPASTLIAINRAGGITRALTAPTAGAKPFGGKAAVVDLSGRVQSITKANAAQTVQMGASGAMLSGNTRLGAWAVLREYLDEALSYAVNPRDYVRSRNDKRFATGDLKALGPVVSGAVPLIVSINRASDIRTLIRLKSNYGINVIILGGSEAWIVARQLAAANIPVILNPQFNLPAQFEDLGATLANAARLHRAGVRIAFADGGSHNLRLMPQLAGNAVANGLPHDAALAALTLHPATMFGLQSRLGSIEPGKAADIVIWDGDPLEVTTRPVSVLIDGRVTSLENRQTKLRDRYKDLSTDGLPFAYRGAD